MDAAQGLQGEGCKCNTGVKHCLSAGNAWKSLQACLGRSPGRCRNPTGSNDSRVEVCALAVMGFTPDPALFCRLSSLASGSLRLSFAAVCSSCAGLLCVDSLQVQLLLP